MEKYIWCSGNTNGLIKGMVTDISSDVVMYLLIINKGVAFFSHKIFV